MSVFHNAQKLFNLSLILFKNNTKTEIIVNNLKTFVFLNINGHFVVARSRFMSLNVFWN